VINLWLIRVALSPIAALERLAEDVSRGEFAKRATHSLVADSQIVKLTDTVNALLDSLAIERRRIQKLGALVVSAQDTERALMARELHDSIAQTLAAARFQLAAASVGASDDSLRNALATTRGMIGNAIDEVRTISQSLHPRVAEDLGLLSAVQALAQENADRGALEVNVSAEIDETGVPVMVAATMFRVVQEALKKVERRGLAESATVLLYSTDGTIRVEVSEDKIAMDRRPLGDEFVGNGLASIRDRVSLGGGAMRIETGKNGTMMISAEMKIREDDE
jgi:signal transduction histidine kinase